MNIGEKRRYVALDYLTLFRIVSGDRFINIAALLCIFSSLTPFLVSPLPMMPDVFNHTARYYLIYADRFVQERMARFYEVKWSLIGNLGMDLIVYPFIKLFGVETGSFVATALLAPLSIVSLIVFSTAVWGCIIPSFFLAIIFVYTYSFLFGFVNYHLSVSIALLVAAAWIAYPKLRSGWGWLLFCLLSAGVWIAHVGGWAVLVCLIGSVELVESRQSGRSPFQSLTRAAWRSIPVLTPVLLNIISSVANHTPMQIGQMGGRTKVTFLQIVLASEWKPFDVACIALLTAIAVCLIVKYRNNSDPRLMLASGLLALMFLVIPSHVLGSFYADERILPVLFMILFLSFAPTDKRVQAMLILGGAALFSSRLILTSIGWHQRGMRAEADLAVLGAVPEGSRIAVFGTPSYASAWPLSGLDELPNLLIIRRNAFVNTGWDMAATQIMRPVYNISYGLKDSHTTNEASFKGLSASEFMASLPQSRFDYVWSFSTSPLSASWLQPVVKAPDGTLYRIIGAG